LFIQGTGSEHQGLVAWRIFAMLMFFLPIIIFDAMLKTQADGREAAGEPS
jgi:hypothetical protein